VTTAGLRERKKEATREALAAAALRLAVERGPDHVTVEDIAAEADVSVRTFFNYFCSKEQAMVAPNAHRADEMAAELLVRPRDETPLEALHAALVSSADRYAARADEWSLREQLLREHPALMRWHLDSFARLERRLVEAMQARLGIEPEVDPYPALVVNATLATLRSAVAWWRTPACHADLAAVLDDAMTTLAGGLAPPARRRRSPRTTLA
jgi:AcrR family transcriptional regulator